MNRALRAGVIGCIALGAASAQGARGQGGSPLGVVSGYVVDAHGQPIRGARVLALGTPRIATAGAQGEYRLDSVPAGQRMIRVRAPRYATLDLALAVPPADIADLDVRLDSAPPPADTLAPPDAPDLLKRAAAKAGFELYVTRPEFDRRHERNLTDYLRGHPWVTAHRGNAWSEPTASYHAALERIGTMSQEELARLQTSTYAVRGATFAPHDECGHAWSVMLDGVPLDPQYRLDDIAVGAVSGMAIRLPVAHELEDPRLGNSPACGIVFVYTR